MKADLKKAIDLLSGGEYTCVLCKGDIILTSTERGVKPLLNWLSEEKDLSGFCVADKVAGKAAAFLYVMLGVDTVYASIMSKEAVNILSKNGIEFLYDLSVTAIRNRINTDLCPMEKALQDVEDPQAALKVIKDKIKQMMVFEK